MKAAKYHSILADEVTSSNQEILSVVARYLNEEKDIREVFLDFLNLNRITGEHTGKRLLQFYQENGVDVGSCRGQCYDEASNMQSLRKGVASYILKESPNAIVTHCSPHNLNLSIAATSKIPIIDNILEVYKGITIFFNTSPKRQCLLENVPELRCVSAEKRKILVGMCKTRWSERDVAYEHFYLAIPFLAEALEVILGTHADLDQLRSDFTNGWDSKTKKEASTSLNALTTLKFLIGIITLYRLLHPLSSVTQKLQGCTADIVYAYNNMQEAVDNLNYIRKYIVELYKEADAIYQQALRMVQIVHRTSHSQNSNETDAQK